MTSFGAGITFGGIERLPGCLSCLVVIKLIICSAALQFSTCGIMMLPSSNLLRGRDGWPSYAYAALCIPVVACYMSQQGPRATDAPTPIVTPSAIRLEQPQPRTRYLCATNEDVVERDVDQLDNVSDETHDQN